MRNIAPTDLAVSGIQPLAVATTLSSSRTAVSRLAAGSMLTAMKTRVSVGLSYMRTMLVPGTEPSPPTPVYEVASVGQPR